MNNSPLVSITTLKRALTGALVIISTASLVGCKTTPVTSVETVSKDAFMQLQAENAELRADLERSSRKVIAVKSVEPTETKEEPKDPFPLIEEEKQDPFVDIVESINLPKEGPPLPQPLLPPTASPNDPPPTSPPWVPDIQASSEPSWPELNTDTAFGTAPPFLETAPPLPTFVPPVVETSLPMPFIAPSSPPESIVRHYHEVVIRREDAAPAPSHSCPTSPTSSPELPSDSESFLDCADC